MKKLFIAYCFVSLMSIYSCTPSSTKEDNKSASDEKSTHNHSHDGTSEHDHSHGEIQEYACPMHPEVVSDEPGTCSKCGMDLVKGDHAKDDKEFTMEFEASPSTIKANVPVLLSFRPVVKGKEKSLVPLDVVHEKKIHLLIFSKDLSYFSHEHPEYNSSGLYTWKHTFPRGGDFILFQDYTPVGGGHQLGRQDIKVEGKENAVVPLGSQRLIWNKDSYNITLSADKSFLVNSLTELKVHITKDGKPVTNLTNYLGALAHMIVISEDTKEYLHVHPMESASQGPDIMLHTSFPKKGKYKVFTQFDHNGLHTADFIIEVK